MGRFSSILVTELRKALGRNLWFWVSLGVGLALALHAAWESSVVFANTLEQAREYWDVSDVLYSAASCFSFWMLINPFQSSPGIFIMVWPLLAAIPYAWSWRSEERGGVLGQSYARAGRTPCLAAKALAVFVSGALAVGVPVAANLIACACFAPASPVWISDVLYVGVDRFTVLSSLFYNNPLAFSVVWTLVVSLLAGLWAMAVSGLCAVVGNFLETLVVSYLFLHVLAFVGEQLRTLLEGFVSSDVLGSALVSLDTLFVPAVRSLPGEGAFLLVVLGVLLLVSVLFPVLLRNRDTL